MAINEYEFAQARMNLTEFVIRKADALKKHYGFGYEEVDTLDATYESVKANWRESLNTKEPFKVWSGASDNTMFINREANWANRFWHDSIHARFELDFSVASEIQVGMIQVDAVEAAFGKGSLEARMMHADSIGQSLWAERMGEFPTDQLQFVRDVVGEPQA